MKIEMMETGGSALQTALRGSPQGRPPVANATPSLKAIQALERYGYQKSDPQRFARAHAEQCCHLCHMPYAIANVASPCPHWFLKSWRDLQGFGIIFEMHGLSGVLHYLLDHGRGESAPRQPRVLVNADEGPGYRRLELLLNGRRWTFELRFEEDPPHIAITLNTRSVRRPRVAVSATAEDVAVMMDVVGVVAGT